MTLWCARHGFTATLPYAVCVHVLTGAAIDHITEPQGPVEPGLVLCMTCLVTLPAPIELQQLVCGHCADQLFAAQAIGASGEV